MNGENSKVWLVKSAGMVMGPFSLEEVIKILEDRRVSIIDEIRSPNSRWSFIREHVKFKEVVQFLREQQSQSKEDTGRTQSGTKTITNTGGFTDEVTLTPVMPAETIENEESFEVLEAPRERVQEKPMTYAFGSDQTIQKGLRRSRRRFAFVAWTAFVIVITVLIGVQYMVPREAPKSLSGDDYLRLARSNKSLGNLESALEFFKKSESLKPLDTANQLLMIPLLMTVENQNVRARQMLEQILPTQVDGKAQNLVDSLIALTYLREGQLDEAERRYQELVKKNPKQDSLRMNLIEITILQGQFDTAYKNLTELAKEGVLDLNLLLYRALAVYRASETKIVKDRLETSLADLRRYLGKTQDYKPETLLLTLAIQKRLGLDLDAGVTANQLINVYPDLTREHNHDEQVHGEILQWNYLSNICKELVKQNPSSPAYLGLNSYCTYQMGDLKTALEQIEKARSQFSSETALLGMHAFLLVKSGRSSEASAIFKTMKPENSALAHVIEARWCAEQKDWNCSEKQWKSFQELEAGSVEAYSGLAQVSAARGQKDMAVDFLKQGLLISGNYRPLLVLKDQLNE